jgi:hypothetical protein
MSRLIPIDFELNRFTELRRRLIEDYPELDDETLFDTLDGATNLKEAVGELVRSALVDEALENGLKARIDEMKQRLSRFQSTAQSKREFALKVMEEAGLEKLLEPDFTVSLRTSPCSLVVLDEQDIPDTYWVPQPPKLNRKAALDAIKHGQQVPGVTLSNSRVSLSVRRK